MSSSLQIAVVIASSRPQRVGPEIAAWVMAGTEGREATYTLVDLADQDLPNYDEPQPAASGDPQHAHTRAWQEKVDGFDGFVFVTPEYNRGIPGQLKNAIDYCYEQWNDKAAGIVCYGSSGGTRAAEQLSLVLGEVQVATVRAQVALSIHDDLEDFTTMAPRAYQARNLAETLRQVERWAGALKGLRG